MSWVCDICSSNNDDGALQCFVCESKRPKSSILAAKRRLREKKFDEFAELLYSKFFFGIKIAVLAVVAFFIIGCIIKIAQGKLFSDLETNTTAIMQVTSLRVKSFADTWTRFDMDRWRVIKTWTSSLSVRSLTNLAAFSESILAIVSRLFDNFSHIYSNALYALPSANKFEGFLAIMHKTTENLPYAQNFFTRSALAVGEKWSDITGYVRLVVNIAKSNMERFVVVFLYILHNGMTSLRNCGDYVSRIVLKLKK